MEKLSYSELCSECDELYQQIDEICRINIQMLDDIIAEEDKD